MKQPKYASKQEKENAAAAEIEPPANGQKPRRRRWVIPALLGVAAGIAAVCAAVLFLLPPPALPRIDSHIDYTGSYLDIDLERIQKLPVYRVTPEDTASAMVERVREYFDLPEGGRYALQEQDRIASDGTLLSGYYCSPDPHNFETEITSDNYKYYGLELHWTSPEREIFSGIPDVPYEDGGEAMLSYWSSFIKQHRRFFSFHPRCLEQKEVNDSNFYAVFTERLPQTDEDKLLHNARHMRHAAIRVDSSRISISVNSAEYRQVGRYSVRPIQEILDNLEKEPILGNNYNAVFDPADKLLGCWLHYIRDSRGYIRPVYVLGLSNGNYYDIAVEALRL